MVAHGLSSVVLEMGVEFDEIVVETDRLAFPALAAGDGPPLVCWHGFPDHPATFAPLAEHLTAAGYRVIAPFLRGHHPAHADQTRYMDGITLAADAAALAAALDVGGSGVDLVGHDIGAGMVQRVAAAWPHRIRRGITLAVPPPAALADAFTDPAQLERSFYIWLFQLEGLAERVLERDTALIDYLWATWSPSLSQPPAHYEQVRRLYTDPAHVQAALRLYRAPFTPELKDPALASWREDTERRAAIPLLLAGGADDGCIDPAHLRASEQLMAPGSRVEVLSDAGHFVHLERPQPLANLILSWLDR